MGNIGSYNIDRAFLYRFFWGPKRAILGLKTPSLGIIINGNQYVDLARNPGRFYKYAQYQPISDDIVRLRSYLSFQYEMKNGYYL